MRWYVKYMFHPFWLQHSPKTCSIVQIAEENHHYGRNRFVFNVIQNIKLYQEQ
jgi:hypothetical protein